MTPGSTAIARIAQATGYEAAKIELVKDTIARGATAEPTAEMRNRQRDERIAKLEQWIRSHEPLLDMVEQFFAQSQ